MDFVYLVEGKDYAALKLILEADSLASDSFSRMGYQLRESKSLGLKGGNYVLHFRCDEETAKKQKERLKPLPSLKELEGAEKGQIVSKLEEDENAAAAGFGNIFG